MTHNTELEQLIGFAIHVGASVQQDGGTFEGRQLNGDGGSIHSLQWP